MNACQTIEVTKLTPVIGAEISGVDLSGEITDQQFEEIHDALMAHLVIFFRDQDLTIEQHKAFGRRFGDLHVHPNAPQDLPDHPEILVVAADENSKHVAGEVWHTDVSSDAEPPMGSILHMSVVPPDGGGDTMFASMYEAYERLAEPVRRMIEGMTAFHDSAKAHGYRLKQNDRANMTLPSSEHPVVRTHPVTGRKALYVNRGFTTRIRQLPGPDSDAVLEMLYRHIETPEFQCRFRWRPNSIAFWDNRATQHRALFDYQGERRYGQRVTVCGDRPYHRA